MRKIKAVLFDMDGVLIDACSWHRDAFIQALNYYGYDISIENHDEYLDGLPTMGKLKVLTAIIDLPVNLYNDIYNKKQELTKKIIDEKCVPVKVRIDAVSKLKQEGYKLAVCSNSIRSSVISMLTKSGLIEYFDILISNEDIDKPKPAADIYLKAMNELDLKPNECLVLEDNINGIQAAIKSGANLLKIGDISEVNYDNIKKRIDKVEHL